MACGADALLGPETDSRYNLGGFITLADSRAGRGHSAPAGVRVPPA